MPSSSPSADCRRDPILQLARSEDHHGSGRQPARRTIVRVQDKLRLGPDARADDRNVIITRCGHLFGLLDAELDGIGLDPESVGALPAGELALRFGDAIRRFVRFAARHPELNRIMVHEGCTATDRLRWLTDQYIRPIHVLIAATWTRLRSVGIAAPVPVEVVHHVLVGVASLPRRRTASRDAMTGDGASRAGEGHL